MKRAVANGTRPTKLDKRDFSFHRTFGVADPFFLPPEYLVDAGLTMPDQSAEGNPFSCTAYTTDDLGTDQDGKVYCEEYTYMKTLFMQGLPPDTNGSNIRPALKSASVYGLLPDEEMPESLKGKGEDFTADQGNWPAALDAIAGKLQNRKGKYFNVYIDGGLDWFDSFRSALWKNKDDKRGISIGTPWFAEWAQTQQGIVTGSFTFDPKHPEWYAWHNWAIKGWRVIDGETYLIGKTWQGKGFGDGGWAYFSREAINKVMEIRGCIAFTLKDAEPSDIKSIQIGILEYILLYAYRILGRIRLA